MFKKRYLIASIILISIFTFALFACKKDNKNPNEVKKKPNDTNIIQTDKDLLVRFNKNGEIIKEENIKKYSDIKQHFIEIEKKHNKDRDFLGLYTMQTKLTADFFDQNLTDIQILTDMYGNYRDKKISFSKDITIFLKYKNPDYLFSYTYDDGVYLSKDIKNWNKYNIVVKTIPNKINNVPVKAIGMAMYMGREFVEGVSIPDTVTHIEKGAFATASTPNIKLSKNLKEIGSYAFSDMWDRQTYLGGINGVEVLTYPYYVISHHKTKKIKNPYRIIIPESVVSIDTNAFAFNYGIREIRFKGDSIEKLMGIYGMERLDYIKLPGKIEKMGYFSNFKSGIKNFIMPLHISKFIDETDPRTIGGQLNTSKNTGFMNNVGDSGDGNRFNIVLDGNNLPVLGFNNNDSVKNVTIKSTNIGVSGINGKNIEEVSIEDGVKFIINSFNNSEKLTRARMPKSIIHISGSFSNNSKLSRVELVEGIKITPLSDRKIINHFKNDQRLFNYERKELNLAQLSFNNNPSLFKLKIPKSINNFHLGFDDCTNLKEIELHENIESLQGFNNCNIENLDFSAQKKLVELSGFNDSNIKNLVLPSSLESITNFGSKNKVNKIDISIRVKSINKSFNFLYDLQEVNILGNTSDIEDSFNFNYNTNKLSIGEKTYSLNNSFLHSINLNNIIISPKNPELIYEKGVLFNKKTKTMYRAENQKDVPLDIKYANKVSIYGIPSNSATLIYPSYSFIESTIYLTDLYKVFDKRNNLFTKQPVTNDDYTTQELHKFVDINTSFYGLKLENSEKITTVEFPKIQKSDLSVMGNISNRFINLKKFIVPKEYGSTNLYLSENDKFVEEIIFEDGTEIIKNLALRNSKALTIIKIPSSVIKISRYAFYNIKSVKYIEIPASVKTVAEGAFFGWGSDQTIKVNLKEENLPVAKLSGAFVAEGWITNKYISSNNLDITAWNGNNGVNIIYLK